MQLVTILLVFSCTAFVRSAPGDCPVGCIYSFTNPKYPSFTLPPAQPNSPGDVTLNTGNVIRFTNGSSIAAGQTCNSGALSAYTSNGWTSTYANVNGASSSFSNAIYATQLNVKARTIQSNQANLASFLTGLPLKLMLTCNNGLQGCIYFTVGGTSSNTIPDAVSCQTNSGD